MHRSGARTRKAHVVVDLSQGALEKYCGHGLLRSRGPHAARLSDVLRSVCARPGKPNGEDCRYYFSSARSVDGADGAQSHRCRIAFPWENAIPDHGSRYEVLRSVPRGTHSRADRADQTAAAITKFECICGEIRPLSEDGVYRADGLLQQSIA